MRYIHALPPLQAFTASLPPRRHQTNTPPPPPSDDVHAGAAPAAASKKAKAKGGGGEGKGAKAASKAVSKGPAKDEEFGVTRGIDFKGVRTIINYDLPGSVAGALLILVFIEFWMSDLLNTCTPDCASASMGLGGAASRETRGAVSSTCPPARDPP